MVKKMSLSQSDDDCGTLELCGFVSRWNGASRLICKHISYNRTDVFVSAFIVSFNTLRQHARSVSLVLSFWVDVAHKKVENACFEYNKKSDCFFRMTSLDHCSEGWSR